MKHHWRDGVMTSLTWPYGGTRENSDRAQQQQQLQRVSDKNNNHDIKDLTNIIITRLLDYADTFI